MFKLISSQIDHNQGIFDGRFGLLIRIAPQPSRGATKSETRCSGPVMNRALNPKEWAKPKGYANGIAARGTLVFVAGQIGWNGAKESFETDDFAGQVRQALSNVVAVLAEAGAKPEHIVRFTWYVTDKREYLACLSDVGRAYRETIGRHYPAMALVEVRALVEDRAKVEIEATAVIPD
jgi:enamine deaminase RidA (YjgF/YER057c/UK114 family)